MPPGNRHAIPTTATNSEEREIRAEFCCFSRSTCMSAFCRALVIRWVSIVPVFLSGLIAQCHVHEIVEFHVRDSWRVRILIGLRPIANHAQKDVEEPSVSESLDWNRSDETV